jgi:hypothetical protein
VAPPKPSLLGALAAHGSPWLLALLLTLQLASIWTVAFLPTQDGPVHLEIASQLRSLARGGGGVVTDYYQLNARPEPNWAVYPLLEALARATNWRVAEKLVVSGYLLAMVLALAYALAAVRTEAVFLTLLALPLGANYLFHMGFLNFCLSVPLALTTLGAGLRADGPLRGWRLAGVTALLLATSAAHPVSACAAAAGLIVAGAWRGFATRGPLVARRRRAGEYAARALVAALPALLLVASFLAGPSRHGVIWHSPLDRLRRFVFLHVLVSYDRVELAPAIALGCLLASLAFLRLAGRRALTPWQRGTELLVVAVMLMALYFLVPDGVAGGGYLGPRLALWTLLFAILWLGAEPWDAARRRILTTAVAALTGVFILVHALAYRRLSNYLEEYVSVLPQLAAESALLPLSFVDEEWRLTDRSLSGYKIHPFEHAVGYLASERALVDLTEYQADQGYFPVVYREGFNPYRRVVPEEGVVTAALDGIDWRGYEHQGARIDYVLLWGRAASTPWPGEGPFLERLQGDFEPVFTSRPHGLMELYRRRSTPAHSTESR